MPRLFGRIGCPGVGLAAMWLAAGCAGVDPYEVELERGEVAPRVGDPEDAADAQRREPPAPGDSARALKLLRRLERLDAGHSGIEALRTEAPIAEGGRLQGGRRPEEAEVLFREALGSGAAGADATLGLAKTPMESDRVDTVISVLSDALPRHPEDRCVQALLDRALEIRCPNRPPSGDSPGSGGGKP